MSLAPEILESSFSVSVESRGTVSGVAVSGELDLASSDAVQDALDEAVEQASEILVVDLSETTFIDSTGLHAVIRCERRAAAAGLSVVVIGACPQVRRVFELAGLDTRFSFA